MQTPAVDRLPGGKETVNSAATQAISTPTNILNLMKITAPAHHATCHMMPSTRGMIHRQLRPQPTSLNTRPKPTTLNTSTSTNDPVACNALYRKDTSETTLDLLHNHESRLAPESEYMPRPSTALRLNRVMRSGEDTHTQTKGADPRVAQFRRAGGCPRAFRQTRRPPRSP